MVKRYLIILAGLLFMLSGCGKTAGNEVEPESEQAAEPERSILFILNYTDSEDDFENKGYFIDSDGAKSYYDLSEKGESYADTDKIYQYLAAHISEYEPEKFLSPEEVEQCREYLGNIDADAEPEHFNGYSSSFHFNNGDTVLYGIRTENDIPELVFIRGEGSERMIITEDNTRQIADIFGSDLEQ